MILPPSDLRRLFNPKAIAVIGASNREGNIGRIIFERLVPSLRKLYPVHPRETAVLGHEAYADIAALPSGIDIAIIATGAATAVEAAAACAGRRIPFLIIVAGGFGETGPQGKQLEIRLQKIGPWVFSFPVSVWIPFLSNTAIRR